MQLASPADLATYLLQPWECLEHSLCSVCAVQVFAQANMHTHIYAERSAPAAPVPAGENSGVRGGTSGATGPPARSGAAAALTATSQNALTNLDHVRLR